MRPKRNCQLEFRELVSHQSPLYQGTWLAALPLVYRRWPYEDAKELKPQLFQLCCGFCPPPCNGWPHSPTLQTSPDLYQDKTTPTACCNPRAAPAS